MSTHVVEAGPSTIRELCCGRAAAVDSETVRAALDGIDDPVVLADDRPVCLDSLWRDALGSVECGSPESAIVVHPSWWTPTRVERVGAAAEILADDVVMRPRSWLLAQASPLGPPHAAVVVEIADPLVVVTGAAVVAEPRRGEPQRTAEAVVRSAIEMTSDETAVVVIDAPSTVDGADALATMIADGLRAGRYMTVVQVDDARFRELAAAVIAGDDNDGEVSSARAVAGGHRRHRWLALVVVLITAVLGVSALGHHRAPVATGVPTTFLVEGRVALEVPAQWLTQRVIAGPGSARVQVTSPSDPEVALHVTQSRVAAETLGGTAESLKHAIDAEPAGVFVDFNPAGSSAGRPAVIYREVRAAHDIRWTVLLDRAVRISIGCQSRPGHEDAVREVCERAVRSARAIG